MKHYLQPLLIASTVLFVTVACAQNPSGLQAVDYSAGRSLVSQGQIGPGIEFVEVNIPDSVAAPKQLLLFVHGTPGSLSAFQRYLDDPLLRDRYHMIAVTRPGWVSNSDKKVPSLEDQASALEPLLRRDQSGLGAILMGHSYGGPVIAKAAMQYPELVAGLALIASTGDPQLSGPRWYNRFASVLPRFLLGASLKGANAEIMPLVPQLQDMLPGWESLDIPVLVVQGDRDRLVHPLNAEFLVDSLVNADVTYLPMPGKGHFILWEDKELIRDTLLEVFDPSAMLACEPASPSVPETLESGPALALAC
ncbi:MAG: alpha/beta hydrolase [Gammaproteobacteria bacterium]|nr:alpha/beta hydrolase [Gammaproteobacteria bacterium]